MAGVRPCFIGGWELMPEEVGRLIMERLPTMSASRATDHQTPIPCLRLINKHWRDLTTSALTDLGPYRKHQSRIRVNENMIKCPGLGLSSFSEMTSLSLELENNDGGFADRALAQLNALSALKSLELYYCSLDNFSDNPEPADCNEPLSLLPFCQLRNLSSLSLIFRCHFRHWKAEELRFLLQGRNRSLTRLSLSDCTLTPCAVEALGCGAEALKEISLCNVALAVAPGFTGKTLANALGQLTNLEKLSLRVRDDRRRMRRTEEGIRHLFWRNLAELQGLRMLQHMELFVGKADAACPVLAADVASLLRVTLSLRSLDITSLYASDVLLGAVAGLATLNTLRMSAAVRPCIFPDEEDVLPRPAPAALAAFACMRSLQSLHLDYSMVLSAEECWFKGEHLREELVRAENNLRNAELLACNEECAQAALDLLRSPLQISKLELGMTLESSRAPRLFQLGSLLELTALKTLSVLGQAEGMDPLLWTTGSLKMLRDLKGLRILKVTFFDSAACQAARQLLPQVEDFSDCTTRQINSDNGNFFF